METRGETFADDMNITAETPNDWHAREGRRQAEENRANLEALPMSNVSPADEAEKNQPGDILAGVAPGTTEKLFNIQEAENVILTNCVKAEELSESTNGAVGLDGISKLMQKSMDALTVSTIKIQKIFISIFRQ